MGDSVAYHEVRVWLIVIKLGLFDELLTLRDYINSGYLVVMQNVDFVVVPYLILMDGTT